MQLGISKKTALVTASTSGIGFSIAHLLAQEGVDVYINGRTNDGVSRAIDSISKLDVKGKVLPLVCDFGKQFEPKTLAQLVPQVDILINNLGIYEAKPFEQITDESWMKFFEVNVMSGIRLSRYFLPKMIDKKWGRIVFISSESAMNVPSEMIHYGLTKTAQLSLTQGLAQICKGTGVTVNAVLPGPTRTDGVEAFITEVAQTKNLDRKTVEEDFFKNVRPTSLIQRFASPDEVASLVTYVCSEQAAAITGTSLRVDGGILRSL